MASRQKDPRRDLHISISQSMADDLRRLSAERRDCPISVIVRHAVRLLLARELYAEAGR